ncbi:MAG: rod shape-determining protein MreC [Proteobacteria bacterium]|nr:rod shape-determining protein MreC [Pseudomonadota bacterium]
MALTRNDTVPLFSPDTANTLRLIAYLALAIALMVIDHRNGWLVQVRYFASAAVEPMYRLAALPSRLARSAGDAMSDRARLNQRNAELERELLLAQARLNRLQSVRDQNERLQQLLEAQRSLNLGVQLARIIDVDTDPFRHRVTIDAGARQGVAVGEAVLDAHGVMGQVVEVLPNASTVMLITDPAHALPVKSERTGLRAIARGNGALDSLELPNVPISADIKPGDMLVTSGLGGHFPAGFPVGTVRNIRNDASGMFAVATLTPSAALDRSGEVLILHNLPDPVGPPAPAPSEGPPAESAPVNKAPNP